MAVTQMSIQELKKCKESLLHHSRKYTTSIELAENYTLSCIAPIRPSPLPSDVFVQNTSGSWESKAITCTDSKTAT